MTFGRSNRITTALAAGVLVAAAEARAQRPTLLDATRSSPAELRAGDRLVDQRIRDRALVATSIETDPLYHLAYFGQATTALDIQNVFIDANTGAPLQQLSDFIREVGHGKGTFASAASARQTGGHAGFNAAADLSYILRPHVGVGLEISVSRARVPFDNVTVDAGGLHIGGGLRFRF